jgi:deoxycytidylate deaminase
MIINANIAAVYYEEGYEDELSDQMLHQAGVELINWTSREGDRQ